jgi:hypothetical protein
MLLFLGSNVALERFQAAGKPSAAKLRGCRTGNFLDSSERTLVVLPQVLLLRATRHIPTDRCILS